MGNNTWRDCAPLALDDYNGRTVARIEVYHDEFSFESYPDDYDTRITNHGLRVVFTDGTALDIVELGQVGSIGIKPGGPPNG